MKIENENTYKYVSIHGDENMQLYNYTKTRPIIQEGTKRYKIKKYYKIIFTAEDLKEIFNNKDYSACTNENSAHHYDYEMTIKNLQKYLNDHNIDINIYTFYNTHPDSSYYSYRSDSAYISSNSKYTEWTMFVLDKRDLTLISQLNQQDKNKQKSAADKKANAKILETFIFPNLMPALQKLGFTINDRRQDGVLSVMIGKKDLLQKIVETGTTIILKDLLEQLGLSLKFNKRYAQLHFYTEIFNLYDLSLTLPVDCDKKGD